MCLDTSAKGCPPSLASEFGNYSIKNLRMTREEAVMARSIWAKGNKLQEFSNM